MLYYIYKSLQHQELQPCRAVTFAVTFALFAVTPTQNSVTDFVWVKINLYGVKTYKMAAVTERVTDFVWVV